MSSIYFQTLLLGFMLGFINTKCCLKGLFLKKKRNSPTLLRWSFGFIFVAVVILNAFYHVVLVAVISAVRTRPGWFVASCLEMVLNVRGKLEEVATTHGRKKC